jgi:hypothetical protein
MILVSTDNPPTQMVQSEIEQRVRSVTGRADVDILNIREVRNGSGKVVAYEVDIK